MCKFGLIVRLPGDVYLMPSLMRDAGMGQRQNRILFFVSRQPILKIKDKQIQNSSADRKSADDIGYVQSGFFNRVLANLIEASDIESTADLDFAKSFATMKYGHIYYNIRAHKSYISLGVDETNVGSCVELASHVDEVICGVMKQFQMNAFSMCSLLEHERHKDTYLSYERIRTFVESEQQQLSIRDMKITREDMLTQHAPWMYDNGKHTIDERLPSNSRYKMAILQCLPLNAGYDSFERAAILEIMTSNENKHFDENVICCEAFSMDDL